MCALQRFLEMIVEPHLLSIETPFKHLLLTESTFTIEGRRKPCHLSEDFPLILQVVVDSIEDHPLFRKSPEWEEWEWELDGTTARETFPSATQMVTEEE